MLCLVLQVEQIDPRGGVGQGDGLGVGYRPGKDHLTAQRVAGGPAVAVDARDNNLPVGPVGTNGYRIGSGFGQPRGGVGGDEQLRLCLLYTSPSPRDS